MGGILKFGIMKRALQPKSGKRGKRSAVMTAAAHVTMEQIQSEDLHTTEGWRAADSRAHVANEFVKYRKSRERPDICSATLGHGAMFHEHMRGEGLNSHGSGQRLENTRRAIRGGLVEKDAMSAPM